MTDEIFDVVDLKDRVLSQASRGEIHRNNLFHRAVHIFIARANNCWVLQQRSKFKDLDPLLWTSSCSGHVDAGENYLCAAIRECEEELGFVVDADSFVEVFRASPCCETGHEFVRVYILRYEGYLRIDEREVIAFEEYSLSAIEDLIKLAPNTFSGSFLHLFPFIKKGICSHKSRLS
jgi:isopentenyldiphosphate isomerase